MKQLTFLSFFPDCGFVDNYPGIREGGETREDYLRSMPDGYRNLHEKIEAKK